MLYVQMLMLRNFIIIIACFIVRSLTNSIYKNIYDMDRLLIWQRGGGGRRVKPMIPFWGSTGHFFRRMGRRWENVEVGIKRRDENSKVEIEAGDRSINGGGGGKRANLEYRMKMYV
jgi:hypothetical protein